MKKKMTCFALALVFTLSTVSIGFAARLTCTVDAVEGEKVTMTCKKADKLAPGDKVRVSTPKKASIEGC